MKAEISTLSWSSVLKAKNLNTTRSEWQNQKRTSDKAYNIFLLDGLSTSEHSKKLNHINFWGKLVEHHLNPCIDFLLHKVTLIRFH